MAHDMMGRRLGQIVHAVHITKDDMMDHHLGQEVCTDHDMTGRRPGQIVHAVHITKDDTTDHVNSEDSAKDLAKSGKAGERVRKLKHNPYMAVAVTLKKLGIMHSGKREFETSHALFVESEKFIRIACNGDSEHVKIAKLNGFVGDACIRERTKKSLQKAMGVYETANRIYGRTVGKDTFLFLHSLSDVGDVFLEQKETKKAQAFYKKAIVSLTELYGPQSVLNNKINSAMIESCSALN